VTDLPTFLLARIAEDEDAARAATIDAWGRPIGHPRGFDWASLALSSERDTTPAQDEHITIHDPARVLAECEAKRIRVQWIADNGAYVTMDPGWLLRVEALPYSSHPDYRREWRP
jgi:hypothetical protein